MRTTILVMKGKAATVATALAALARRVEGR
jgi:hypothetical protein